jgi:hypothetical protein
MIVSRRCGSRSVVFRESGIGISCNVAVLPRRPTIGKTPLLAGTGCDLPQQPLFRSKTHDCLSRPPLTRIGFEDLPVGSPRVHIGADKWRAGTLMGGARWLLWTGREGPATGRWPGVGTTSTTFPDLAECLLPPAGRSAEEPPARCTEADFEPQKTIG